MPISSYFRTIFSSSSTSRQHQVSYYLISFSKFNVALTHKIYHACLHPVAASILLQLPFVTSSKLFTTTPTPNPPQSSPPPLSSLLSRDYSWQRSPTTQEYDSWASPKAIPMPYPNTIGTIHPQPSTHQTTRCNIDIG